MLSTSTVGVQYYGWETVHEPVDCYNPWGNWRIGGFPENTNLAVGITTNTSVLSYKQDQVWRHKDGLPVGYKIHWLLPTTQINGQLGQWSSSNASSGLGNVENTDTYWDWSWQTNTNEEIDQLKGFTFNTSNSNYTATNGLILILVVLSSPSDITMIIRLTSLMNRTLKSSPLRM